MQIEQTRWSQGKGWITASPGKLGGNAQLVLLFGSPACLKQTAWQDDIEGAYPNAHRIGCSTAGEIYGTEVTDETLVATTLTFEHTRLHGVSLKLSDVSDSFQAGERLASALPRESLVHVLVFSANIIAIVGLYGERIKVGFGSFGGWDAFGPERFPLSLRVGEGESVVRTICEV